MSQYSSENATTTDLSTVPDFSLSKKTIDESSGEKEYYWYNDKFDDYLTYYKSLPEYKKSVDTLAMWAVELGYEADARTKVILKKIRGWGKDNFIGIISNMIKVKHFNGNSYAEIISDDENPLINLKTLNPFNVRHVLNSQGILIRYDVWNGKEWKSMDTKKILHFVNGRIANESHGISDLESCKWVLDARNEAMTDKRRILHKTAIRVLAVDASDTATYNQLRNQYAEAMKKGDVLIIDKGKVEFQDIQAQDTSQHSVWIDYLDSAIYKASGVPEIAMGGSQNYSEASSKVGHMTFEQPHKSERKYVEDELRNQLKIEVDFDEPASIIGQMQNSDMANTGQIGFQPNDVQTQVGRTE
jgi:hypothetical protein